MTDLPTKTSTSALFSSEMRIPYLLAMLQFVLLMVFNANYGYFRDELYYIACTKHLAFGYVDQPPLSIVILWLNRMVLGDSLYALRFLPALTSSIVVVLAALTAGKLGGGKFAQGMAALSAVAAHGLIGHGKLFSMNPFDVLFWTLAAYAVISIFRDDRPKLWMLYGLVVGLGLENKYSVGFSIIGLVAGLLLTRQRKHLADKWFWCGAGIATLVFLPHVIWEATNGFPSLEFMRNASENKNINLGAVDFLIGQIKDINVLNAPLWLGGIYFFWKHEGGRYRPLAWYYPVVFVVMVAGHAKIYYLSAIYPAFLAGGAVLFEQIIQKTSWNWLNPAYATLVALMAIIILPLAVPVLPVEQLVKYEHTLGLVPRPDEHSSLGELPQYYADQFGWKEMVDSITTAYRTLSPEEQAHCFIFVRNYGEAGAVDFFGKEYGLPDARCAHNSYWFWGPGKETGDIAIIVGNSRTLEDNLADLRRRYKSVQLITTTRAKYSMPFENGRYIFVCKGMNTTFQQLWPTEKFFI